MHLHLPRRLHAPLVLLSAVYAAALAVALTHPGRPTLAGLVVLAGLAARWTARHRRSAAPAPDVVRTPDTPAQAPAVAH